MKGDIKQNRVIDHTARAKEFACARRERAEVAFEEKIISAGLDPELIQNGRYFEMKNASFADERKVWKNFSPMEYKIFIEYGVTEEIETPYYIHLLPVQKADDGWSMEDPQGENWLPWDIHSRTKEEAFKDMEDYEEMWDAETCILTQTHITGGDKINGKVEINVYLT